MVFAIGSTLMWLASSCFFQTCHYSTPIFIAKTSVARVDRICNDKDFATFIRHTAVMLCHVHELGTISLFLYLQVYALPQQEFNAAGLPIPFRGGYWQRSYVEGECTWLACLSVKKQGVV